MPIILCNCGGEFRPQHNGVLYIERYPHDKAHMMRGSMCDMLQCNNSDCKATIYNVNPQAAFFPPELVRVALDYARINKLYDPISTSRRPGSLDTSTDFAHR